jgi:hypothetical protein
MRYLRFIPLACVLVALATSASADERTAYYQRAAQRDMDAFHALDRNGDGLVTRDAIRGDNNFGPRFDDMDVNRDNVVTQAELARYIKMHYGIDEPGETKVSAIARHPQDTSNTNATSAAATTTSGTPTASSPAETRTPPRQDTPAPPPK